MSDCYYNNEMCEGEVWTCLTCGEDFCEAHGHTTDKGTNVECVACERERKQASSERYDLTTSPDVAIVCRRTSEARVNVPQYVVNHSPDGFEWGYAGSGPADLALNILHHFTKDDYPLDTKVYRGKTTYIAERLHQQFKKEFIMGMEKDGGVIEAERIREWIEETKGSEDFSKNPWNFDNHHF